MTDSEIVKNIINKIEAAQATKLYGQITITFNAGKAVVIKTEKTEKIGVSL